MTEVPASLLGLRLGKKPRDHVESWFVKANEPTGERALWLRTTIFARPGIPTLAEAWAIAFDRGRGHVATKSTTTFDQARIARETVDIDVDGCSLSLRHSRGSLATGPRTLGWDLTFGPALASPILHLPSRALYEAPLPSMKLVTPVSDMRVSGTVRVGRRQGDVEEWNVDAWPAMLGHNWGRRHAQLYAWTHCNVWDVPGLVFEAVSGRVRVGPMLSPLASAAFLRYRDESWDLSSVASLTRNRALVSMRRWELSAERRGLVLECAVDAETDDFVGLHYPNPSGEMTYCLNSKLARATLELTLPSGEKISAKSRAAALEIGTQEPTHGVRMVL